MSQFEVKLAVSICCYQFWLPKSKRERQNCVKHSFGVGKTEMFTEKRRNLRIYTVLFCSVHVASINRAIQKLHFSIEGFVAHCHVDKVVAKPVSYTHLRAHETPEHLVC